MKKRILLISGAALLTAWMFLATPIVAGVYNLSCGMERLYEYPATEGAATVVSAQKNYVRDDPFCSVVIEGIGACYADSSDTPVIKILLMSQRAIYSADTRLSDAGGGADALPLILSNDKEKAKTGFKTTFCPLNMKDGSYRIAALFVEDGAAKALYFYSQNLNKRDRTVTIDSISTTQVEPVSYVLSNELRYSFDLMTQYTDNLILEGWFFKPGMNYSTPLHEVIVETTDASGELSYWSAVVTERREVAYALGLSGDIYTGFLATIPQTDVKQVRLILRTSSDCVSPEEAIPIP